MITTVLSAHDFWIVPTAFAVADDGTIEVRGQTGVRFPTSVSAVTPDRIADARVIGASSDERIVDLTISDNSLLLRHKPTTPGRRIIAVALNPRAMRTTPAGLKRYIALEGNTELADRYDREGTYGRADSLTQRAAKCGADSTTAPKDVSLATNADGVASIPLARPDLWNVRTLHADPVPGAPGEWEVAFATLVFGVGGASTSGDSTDVIAVVARYHSALAAGDSSAALALLAPDAIVLESGGVESRQEYRSSHLPADIGFARAVPSARANAIAVVRGDVAWVSSTSATRGEFRGRQINSSGAELMVLSREADGWKIRAIHWSSRNRNR